MPLDVEYAKSARVNVRASGEVTLTEIEAAVKAILARPDKPGPEILVDAREVDAVPSTPELRIVAREMVPLVNGGLIAVAIVSANPFIFGVSRMFAVFAEGVGAKVGTFHELDEAEHWLAERRRDVKPRRPSPTRGAKATS